MKILDWRHKLPGSDFGPRGIGQLRGVTLHSSAMDERAAVAPIIAKLKKIPGNLAYHYIIARDGTTYMLVDPDHVAKHATVSAPVDGIPPNLSTIGISFANASFARGGKRPRGWRKGPPPPGALYHTAKPTLWHPYTEAQIRAGSELVAWLFDRFGLGVYGRIIGHQDLNPTHPDPGPMFPMSRFKRLVKARLRKDRQGERVSAVLADPAATSPWEAIQPVVYLVGAFAAVLGVMKTLEAA